LYFVGINIIAQKKLHKTSLVMEIKPTSLNNAIVCSDDKYTTC